jgi:AcrR family transcriptional regulator
MTERVRLRAVARGAPAYRRLDVDERRRLLLEVGARLFTTHSYGELSMAAIAREAGISKALLYHYFPSKQELFRATLAQAADDLQAAVAPDPERPPADQLIASLDAYLGWIDAHRDAYAKLLQTAMTVDEVRELVDAQREQTAQTILSGVFADGPRPAAAPAAVRGWLWFMDGACLEWIAHEAIDREELRNLLVGTLVGALTAAGASTTALTP